MAEPLKSQWKDTVQYIEDITYKIWECRDLDLINETYSKDCPLFTLSGCAKGAQEVIDGTAAVLALFPDRCLYPEDILSNGSDKTSSDLSTEMDSHGNIPGIHSSHLISSRMTFHHPAKLAKKQHDQATDLNGTRTLDIGESSHGKQARVWVIAHCIIQNDVIVKEWLVRDNKSLFEQLSVDWTEVAKKWAGKWYQEAKNLKKANINTQDGSTKFSQSDWLKSEYNHISQSQSNDISGSIPLDMSNVEPKSLRSNCYKLTDHIVNAYRRCWDANNSSNSEFDQLYHPHSRFTSPLTRDSVGPSEISQSYQEFYLNPERSQNVKMSINWVILRPETWSEIPHDSSTGNELNNKWVYPCGCDVTTLQRLFGAEQLGSTNQNGEVTHASQELCNRFPEKYTMSIRWTMVGDYVEHSQAGQESIPIVIMGESYLQCVGMRIKKEIQVWDAVGVQAQIELARMFLKDQST